MWFKSLATITDFCRQYCSTSMSNTARDTYFSPSMMSDLMLEARFVFDAFAPKHMVNPVRTALLPLPLCPIMKLVRFPSSISRHLWHFGQRDCLHCVTIKFSSLIDRTVPAPVTLGNWASFGSIVVLSELEGSFPCESTDFSLFGCEENSTPLSPLFGPSE